MNKLIFWFGLMFFVSMGSAIGQTSISGKVESEGEVLAFANVYISALSKGAVTDENGKYIIKDIPEGTYKIAASYAGFNPESRTITVKGKPITLNFNLKEDNTLSEVVISGTLKPVLRIESPVPVEVYTPSFLKKNPTPSVFDALQTVNGVRPQLNCNVCNTGDIHINGLEGPYTLVLIDGMPIVSGLSTVYGLSGIPNSLIDQVEIVKGPASSLYGSEAVGGLINVITKLPEYAPRLSVDIFGTTWGEVNTDLGYKHDFKKASTLVGLNYFNYSNPIDKNGDNFTDVTLQDRISVFNKWNFKRKDNRAASLAGRFFYEDRWGGEMNWNPSYRGGDEVYGESIYTTRYELLGNYQLPIDEKMLFTFSYTDHDQNSVYGDVEYMAKQKIAFGQLTWDKQLGKHDLLFGAATRYNYYDDNTTATANGDENAPEEILIPSLFVQDEYRFNEKHTLLAGARYDYDDRHGNIFTPRLAYRVKFSEDDIIRLNAGTGFRVVNLFTEEHAALTGAREVIIEGDLDPERSYNVNLNYLKKLYFKGATNINLEASAWYTYFTNQILPDYDTNPNQIIYSNLEGHATSQGLGLNVDAHFSNRFKAILGVTYQDVSSTENGIKTQQMLTEKFSGTWALTYNIFKYDLTIDYTGNIFGPMRLPLLGDLDPRPEYSPTWSIQNIQFTYDGIKNFEFYGGIKNLLNWTPAKSAQFLISRAEDPFDKEVTFDDQGNALPTPNNPYALTFDPEYVYAPNQGIRGFFGVRYTLK